MGWLVRWAMVGGLVVVALAASSMLAMPEALVTLAALAIVPLGLAAIDAPDRLGHRDLAMRGATALTILLTSRCREDHPRASSSRAAC
jgi:hypothetical protein